MTRTSRRDFIGASAAGIGAFSLPFESPAVAQAPAGTRGGRLLLKGGCVVSLDATTIVHAILGDGTRLDQSTIDHSWIHGEAGAVYVFNIAR